MPLPVEDYAVQRKPRDVLHIVEGLRRQVPMQMELVIRFDYGSIVPWALRTDGTLFATAEPATRELHTRVQTHGRHMTSSLAITGRHAEAPFERLLAMRNDVGLLSAEFDPRRGHMLGNFPQALSHLALVNTARQLSLASEQVEESARKGERPAAARTTP